MAAAAKTETPTALAKMREPFAPHHISKLPKPTKQQTEAVRADFKKGVRCQICGSWHHPDVIHLDYVGHAALTDRLLDVDPEWSWEPLAFTEVGLPAFDQTGGLWIKLTVLGVTRLGYGHAAAKTNADPGAREKEIIGDALRNAAMRFGAALDLWHKGDLHADDDDDAKGKPANDQRPAAHSATNGTARKDLPFPQGPAKNRTELKTLGREFWRDVEGCGDPDQLDILLDQNRELQAQILADLPGWINGYEKDGEQFEGLTAVIERKRAEFAGEDWRRNPVLAG